MWAKTVVGVVVQTFAVITAVWDGTAKGGAGSIEELAVRADTSGGEGVRSGLVGSCTHMRLCPS